MRRLLFSGATLALIAPGVSVVAETAADNPVVARVNGQEVHRDELQAAYQQLPEQYRQMPIEMLYEPLLQRVIDGKLLSAEAEKENLAAQPAVQAAIARAREAVLRDRYLQQAIDEGTTEPALRKAYEEAKQTPGFAVEEVKASHILLESEDQAKAVIVELDQGADFKELAKSRSKDPSAQQNAGDLGYFRREAMVPEFAAAAFAMEPGTYSKTPTQSQFGWHVILVEDKRTTEPTFEQAEPQLREDVARKIVTALLEDVRKDATIERFNLDGSPKAP
jgi:peptidyl-prolyl cis-trans isomerase C